MEAQAPQDYKDIRVAALARRAAAIPEKYLVPEQELKNPPKDLTKLPAIRTHYTEREHEIISAEAEAILQKIRDRIWTAVQVTEAFCKAAAVANQLTNCLTEVLFDEALDRATYLDKYQATHDGKVVGPLHGLPISLKDQFPTPPHPSSLGIALLAMIPATSEMPLLTILRDMGAVFYVKTNVPTALMMMETKNNVYGETLNPLNTDLSPGGSSGGEGALIAMNGSPLGLGTETGGSTRHPAAWTHLYALKPSTGRVPMWGLSDHPFSTVVLATVVPIARSLDTIRMFYKAFLSQEVSPWLKDPSCLPMPWKEEVIIQPAGRKLRFGITGVNDGLVTVHPPVERALRMTRRALEHAGHEVIDWETPEHPELWANLIDSFIDLGIGTVSHLINMTGEPHFPSMEPFFSKAMPDGNTAVLEDSLSPTSAKAIVHRRTQLQQAYMARWNATATSSSSGAILDGIITPASAWAACKRGTVEKTEYFGFGGVFNALDLPVCTFPVTLADKNLDVKRTNFHPLSELDRAIQDDYDADVYHGGPVGLQIVGRRLEEEKVLEMAKVVSEALQLWTFVVEPLAHISLAAAATYIAHGIKTPGVEPMVHDFWQEQPIKGTKIYYLRNILHDYPDDKCVTIMQNTAASMDDDSLIFIDELILSNYKAYYEAAEMDLTMMVTLAGEERTDEQWRTWIDTAGLKTKEIFTYNKEVRQSIIFLVRK